VNGKKKAPGFVPVCRVGPHFCDYITIFYCKIKIKTSKKKIILE